MSYLPTTHFYIPRIEQRENNLFMEEYYSSTDTKIYIDDIEQTEISYINYSLQEQLKPIYGYSSRTFDDIAIGNRIVTGTLKVPIKNQEAQTPLASIIHRSKNDNFENYNESQQELMDAIDWIANGESISNTEYLEEDDESFGYKTALIQLGYILDYNSSSFAFKQQIKKFQDDHKLEVTGNLDDKTKDEINEALNNKELKTIYLPKGTKIYV